MKTLSSTSCLVVSYKITIYSHLLTVYQTHRYTMLRQQTRMDGYLDRIELLDYEFRMLTAVHVLEHIEVCNQSSFRTYRLRCQMIDNRRASMLASKS